MTSSVPPLRFLLDESTDYPLSIFLSEQGYDVTAIAHNYPRALTDREVLVIAVREQRIVITNDRDFGELVIRQRLPHAGVILFRLHDESIEVKQVRLQDVLIRYASYLREFIVITDFKVRVRRTGNPSSFWLR